MGDLLNSSHYSWLWDMAPSRFSKNKEEPQRRKSGSTIIPFLNNKDESVHNVQNFFQEMKEAFVPGEE